MTYDRVTLSSRSIVMTCVDAMREIRDDDVSATMTRIDAMNVIDALHDDYCDVDYHDVDLRASATTRATLRHVCALIIDVIDDEKIVNEIIARAS